MNHVATDVLSSFHNGDCFCTVARVMLYVYRDTNISENMPPPYSGYEKVREDIQQCTDGEKWEAIVWGHLHLMLRLTASVAILLPTTGLHGEERDNFIFTCYILLTYCEETPAIKLHIQNYYKTEHYKQTSLPANFKECSQHLQSIFNWINQPDAANSQVYYLSFKYSSTCFGHPHAHHQELQQLQ